MVWTISFRPSAEKQLSKLDRTAQNAISRFLTDKVATAESPRRLGEPLTGTLSGLWRYRVQDYRIVCRIQDSTVTVVVVAVAHRREIYR